MKFKLNIPVSELNGGDHEIYEVVRDLEENIGPNIPHDRMTYTGFFNGNGWAIDYRRTDDLNSHYWEVRIDDKHARKP